MRHASRRDRKVTLDFAGRKVVEDKEVVNMYDREDTVVQQVHFGANRGSQHADGPPVFKEEDFGELVNPNIASLSLAAPKVGCHRSVLRSCLYVMPCSCSKCA